MNPQSRIWLCKSNLENDYKNTLTFSSINAQRNYFIGNPSDPTDTGISTKSYSEYTYLRLEQAIKVDDLIDNIDTNNYLVLINNNKYYYYFITSMDYIDEETTKIHIELDVMQTYFFDIEYKQTFVEREHVTDDTPGKHTIPEGLETGEYICGNTGIFDYKSPLSPVFNDWAIVMAVTPDSDLFPSVNNRWYGGVFAGTVFIEFSGTYVAQAGVFIRAMNAVSKLEAITSIFMYPKIAIDSASYSFTFGSTVVPCGLVNSSEEAEQLTIGIGDKPTSLGSYTPRNKKLLTSDYCYFLVNNGVGGAKKYNFEDFADKGQSSYDINFEFIANLTPSGSIMYAPHKYKGISGINTLEAFSGGKYPICSWSGDPYTNWLTQSGVNRAFTFGRDALGLALGAGSLAFGAVTGNPLLMMSGATGLSTGFSSTVNDIVSDVQAKKQHDIAPPELAGNESLGDAVFAYQRTIPKYYYMHIKEEYAKVIDKFFDQFGYQVNILKTPSIHTRSNWNYLKTKSCNFTGNIPQEYMNRIKSIFDKGITFWHKPQYMFDYTQTNSVI